MTEAEKEKIRTAAALIVAWVDNLRSARADWLTYENLNLPDQQARNILEVLDGA